jgi:DNA-binding transcriptional regulator WhiA
MMASTFSYRPKNYSVEQLKKIAQKHHTNLNRYIEDAVVERIRHEKLDSLREPAELLAQKITKVVVEHMGVQLSKPDAATHAKIVKKFDETMGKKKWISDEDARPGR